MLVYLFYGLPSLLLLGWYLRRRSLLERRSAAARDSARESREGVRRVERRKPLPQDGFRLRDQQTQNAGLNVAFIVRRKATHSLGARSEAPRSVGVQSRSAGIGRRVATPH